MELAYDLRTTDGRAVSDTVYLTASQVVEMDLSAAGFGDVDWRRSIAAAGIGPGGSASPSAVPTAVLGAELYRRIGCVSCHSVDGSTTGRLGPTFRGLFGSTRTFTSGASRRADEAYLRQSIREPASQIVQGYNEGMPSYLGVLGDAEVESLVLYIRSLGP
jgi:cytochrome c2